MLSLIYNGFRYALNYMYLTKPKKEDTDEVISRIEHAKRDVDLVDAKRGKKENTKEEDKLNKGCYYKTGHITYVDSNHVVIDDCYTYEKNDDMTSNLKVGDKIYYVMYLLDSNAEPKVRKIISIINDTWDNANAKSEKHTHMIERNIVAKVTKREGRIAVVEPYNIRIDLSKVQSDFVPMIGDWLTIESFVEVNSNSTDLSGEVLEVDRIKSLRSKLDIGVISKYDRHNEVGVIDKRVIFHKRACEPGYIPHIGDKVVSESIESDQGQYSWRSITIVPLIQPSKKFTELPVAINFSPTLSDINDLLQNKYGIVIDDNLEFNLNIEEENTLTVSIQNNGSYAHMLKDGSFMSQKTVSQLSLESPINKNTIINPSKNVTYTFKCKAQFVGISEELFIFNFKDFKIGRMFHINVNAKNISQKTDSESVKHKYSHKINIADLKELNEITCIPGIKPYKSPAFIQVRNGIFKIPQYIWNAVLDIIQSEKSQIEQEVAIGNQIPCLLKPLSFEIYKERFHALLYLEEISQILNLQQYSMESAVMRQHVDYLVLEVPGLAEKRPSLLVGDRAIVSFKWDSSQGELKYEGFIHRITGTEIFLKFNEKFHQEYNREACHITFKCSQTTMHRCHNAVNLALNRLGSDFLFPTKVVQKEPQFYLEEYDIKEKSNHTQVYHKHNVSVSSNNITSINDTDDIIKISSKMSVADRLFPNKPTELLSFEETQMSNVKIETNQNFKTNLSRNTNDNKTNIANTTISSKMDETIIDNEIESYIAQIKKRKLNWFNKKLNYYQKEAVKNIIQGLARPLPYIIFGPPGTGKTVTLCETILQILAVIPESRLLVATPSNSSANLITERLLDSNILKPGDLVRLIAHHCLDDDSIPEKLLPYCATAELAAEGTSSRFYCREDGTKMNCTMSVLGRHRITVGTCSTLGVLYNMGFPRGHFSHVLVDEAGQATEPEIMIPLNFIHSDHGQVVLAGDPMQLGPVTQSKLAIHFGLSESFLSRLLQQFPYQRDPKGFEESCYDPRLVTKLIMNYRSLPEILELPNSLFYDSELQSQISSENSKEAELLEMLRAELPERDGSPPAVVFHGVNGENHRDIESPSWYNLEEATQVYLYLLKLYKYGLKSDDIGIITPYQKQVLQIRDLLLELDLKLPKISSVEGFQGQERNVIILSTVRSCNHLVDEDIKYTLGFIASPKRLNVAITRARALLIILGNPKLLASDPYWRSILTYCIDHGAYTGCNFLPSYITNQ
ncbi:probable RNA helicase armi [Camponotus floridanus]|uniref:probable RNA helicase armi n=1 Tax=Camponotus floridanus TaxID=104421 RepID=UPI000DC664A3|nr:probable RNA helicase armi [Camponotus floridanus]